MRGRLALVVALAAALCGAGPVRAAAGELSDEQRRQVLAEAQAAYDRAISIVRADPSEARRIFRTSAERFQQLVDDGVVNGRLLYNLANAYLQSGEVGLAILNYRRAEALIPGDERVEGNLAHARSIRRSQIAPSGGRALSDVLLTWHRGTQWSTRAWIFVVCWSACWGLLILHGRRPAAPWRYAAGALGLLALATGVSAAADLYHPPGSAAGVVIADDVIVRKGNGEGFEPQFAQPLFQGVEFKVIERRPGWLHIRLPDGSSGWIREEQAGLV